MSKKIHKDEVKAGADYEETFAGEDGVVTNVSATVTPKDDELDLAQFRVPQGLDNNVGVKKHLLRIPVMTKPDKQAYFRTNPDPQYHLQAAILELRDERELYLVTGSIIEEIRGEVKICELYLGITRQRNLFIVALRVPESSGRRCDAWAFTALEAAQMAKTKWVRQVANMQTGAYDIYEAKVSIPEPEWPTDKTFNQLLAIAFRGAIINSLDHPVLKNLRGE